MSLKPSDGVADARLHVEGHLKTWSSGEYLWRGVSKKSLKPTPYQAAHAKELQRLARLMEAAIR